MSVLCWQNDGNENGFDGDMNKTRGSLSLYMRGTEDKSQIWQSMNRIANRDMKKKEKEMESKS